jgi:hypothetical protein
MERLSLHMDFHKLELFFKYERAAYVFYMYNKRKDNKALYFIWYGLTSIQDRSDYRSVGLVPISVLKVGSQC